MKEKTDRPPVGRELAEAVRAAAREGRLSCQRAHGLARELGVPLDLIGQACDELGIKIQDCQLGCF